MNINFDITRSNHICTIPEDTVRRIFDLTVEKEYLQCVGRVSSTCQRLHNISRRFLLERVLEWHNPGFSWVGNIIPGHPEQVTFHSSSRKTPISRSNFENLIKDEDMDSLLTKTLAPFEQSNSSNYINPNFLIMILNLDLVRVKSDYIDIIVHKLLARPRDNNHWFDVALDWIFMTMLKLKLIKKEASYFPAMVNLIIEKEELLSCYIGIFELMFNQGLLIEDAKYFSKILAKASSMLNTTSYSIINIDEDQFIKNLLQIYKISEFFQKVILPEFKILVAMAIVHELFIEQYPRDFGCNINLIKVIIDLEPSASSACCKAIIDKLQYALDRVYPFLEDREAKIKGIQELNDYISSKNSFLSIFAKMRLSAMAATQYAHLFYLCVIYILFKSNYFG